MKLFACLTAYNEELFLDYCLKSIYDYFDKICIIDVAMKNVVENGGSLHSTDSSVEIVKYWQNNDKVHVIRPKDPPKTFPELGMYGLNLAKELKCDWYSAWGVDEIATPNTLKPLRNFLDRCEKNNIMGVNINMYGFSPDMWHQRDFYVPRVGRITDDCDMPFHSCDILRWPKLNSWQSIDPNAPEHVKKMNIDYPFKIWHYNCVGYNRVKFTHDFYKTYPHSNGSEQYAHYLNKDWDYFKNELKCKEYVGKHPKIMLDHPLINERLY